MVDLTSPALSPHPYQVWEQFTSGGASLIPAAVGRGVDAVTGRRSRVARFVNQNRGQNGVKGDTNLPSLRTQKQVEAQQAEQQRLAARSGKKSKLCKTSTNKLTQRGNPPKVTQMTQTHLHNM